MGAALQEWLRWAGSNGVDDKPPTEPTGKDWSALRDILRDYERCRKREAEMAKARTENEELRAAIVEYREASDNYEATRAAYANPHDQGAPILLERLKLRARADRRMLEALHRKEEG